MSDNEIKYEITQNEKYGRYLVAKQDLKAGECIFTDKPFAVGPKADSPPMCLSCYCPWDGSYSCAQCGWPCCDAACESAPAHALNECVVFAAARVRFQPVDDYTAACTQLDCITPLRMILAKERDGKRWSEQLDCMESHTASRQERPVWAADEVNVARYLIDRCKLGDRFDVELLQRVCGILEVNSVEIPSRGCFSIRAIYPQLAVTAHACVPNIVHTILTGESAELDYVAQVRAAVPIKKGEILYLCYTYVLYPTIYRREFLKESKYFDCDCKRCSDPKELGTNMSTLKCSKCDPGVILSKDSLDAMAQWKCTHCDFSTSGQAVRKILMIVQNEIDQAEEIAPGAEAIEMREQLLRKYRSVFHPKHSCLISLKHSLSQLYGRVEGYNLSELPDILLERKMELCRQILEVLDVINPGESRMRGMMLYELHAPLLLLAKNELKCGTLSANKLTEKMMEPMKLLEDAARILSREDPTSPEGIIGQVAVQSLQELQKSVESLSNEK